MSSKFIVIDSGHLNSFLIPKKVYVKVRSQNHTSFGIVLSSGSDIAIFIGSLMETQEWLDDNGYEWIKGSSGYWERIHVNR